MSESVDIESFIANEFARCDPNAAGIAVELLNKGKAQLMEVLTRERLNLDKENDRLKLEEDQLRASKSEIEAEMNRLKKESEELRKRWQPTEEQVKKKAMKFLGANQTNGYVPPDVMNLLDTNTGLSVAILSACKLAYQQAGGMDRAFEADERQAKRRKLEAEVVRSRALNRAFTVSASNLSSLVTYKTWQSAALKLWQLLARIEETKQDKQNAYFGTIDRYGIIDFTYGKDYYSASLFDEPNPTDAGSGWKEVACGLWTLLDLLDELWWEFPHSDPLILKIAAKRRELADFELGVFTLKAQTVDLSAEYLEAVKRLDEIKTERYNNAPEWWNDWDDSDWDD